MIALDALPASALPHKFIIAVESSSSASYTIAKTSLRELPFSIN